MVATLGAPAGAVDPALPVAPDAWGPKITLQSPDGWEVTPVHGTLLPSGKLFIVGIERQPGTSGSTPGEFGRRSSFLLDPTLPAPASGVLTVTPIEQPVDFKNLVSGAWTFNDDLVCGGQTLTADGKYFSAGGTRSAKTDLLTKPVVGGLSYATIFDGSTWTRVPQNMKATGNADQPGARWYPTVTRLPDGRLLVASGFDRVQPDPTVNLSTEIYNPTTGSWEVSSKVGQTPFEIINSDYTHTFVLPQRVGPYDLMMLGEPGVPVLGTSTTPAAWKIANTVRPGSEEFNRLRLANGAWDKDMAPDNTASSAMLPIRLKSGDWGYANGSVLVAGGAHDSVHQTAVDVYDPVAGAWKPSVNTGVERHHPSTVILPDGRVLLVAGHSPDATVRRAMYVDPAQNFRLSVGQSEGGETRGYHNVSILLPDGRVFVGGGRDITTATSLEKPSFRFYYPHYMFTDRPRIVNAPDVLNYGEQFVVGSDMQRPVDAVLVGLGSMTHSFDANQRSIQVQISNVKADSAGGYKSVLTGPAGSQIAPPGPYMLFLLDDRRIPSMAKMVMVR